MSTCRSGQQCGCSNTYKYTSPIEGAMCVICGEPWNMAYEDKERYRWNTVSQQWEKLYSLDGWIEAYRIYRKDQILHYDVQRGHYSLCCGKP